MPLAPNDLPEILESTRKLIEAIDATWSASALPKKVQALLTTIRKAFDKEGERGSKVTKKEFKAIIQKLKAVLLTAVDEKTPEDLRLVCSAGLDLLHTLKTAWRD